VRCAGAHAGERFAGDICADGEIVPPWERTPNLELVEPEESLTPTKRAVTQRLSSTVMSVLPGTMAA